MAVIDLTLNRLMLPGLANYTPPFGTKKAEDVALRTREGCDNFTLAFELQRPVQVSENSSCTGLVEHHSLVELTTANITLALANGAFRGVKVEVMCSAASGSANVLCGSDTYTVESGNKINLIWNGEAWQEEAGGSSGAPVGLTYEQSRWLIFDFSDSSHKSIVIKKGTHIPLDVTSGGETSRMWLHANTDLSFDLSTAITTAAGAAATRTGEANGRDFYVYLAPDTEGVKLVVSTLSTAPSDINASYTVNNTRKIGQFHTLCANTGASLTGIIPADPGSLSVGNSVLIKNVDEDSDFYDFYNCKVTAVATNAVYDTVTVEHPLKGYVAGDILPESVWCLTFRPKCSPDGMVYDPETDIAVDIYLQSGKGRNTKSVYGGTTTRSREEVNHQADMRAVGKKLLTDHEFTSIAQGSNEKTNIAGSAEASVVTTGGHVDTASRRMISFLGCEDCCGAVWQWLDEIAPVGGSQWQTYDTVNAFGQSYGIPYVPLAGGSWGSGAVCSSRSRYANSRRSAVQTDISARGSCRVTRGL